MSNSITDILNDPREAQIFLKALQEAQEEKIRKGKAKQIRDIVPIEKWINNPYYVGPDGLRLYQYWKDTIIDIFQPDKNITQVIFVGGIGIGKCVAGHTRVYTECGYKQIKDLYPNPKEGFNEFKINIKSDEGWEPTSHFYYEKNCKVNYLTLSNGMVVNGTDKHKIMSKKDGVIKLRPISELEIGDKIILNTDPLGEEYLTEEQKFIYNLFKKEGEIHTCTNLDDVKAMFEIMGIPYRIRRTSLGFRLYPLDTNEVVLINKREKVEDVYDLTVPGSHHFYAQGLLNHNTTCAQFIQLRRLYELSCYENILAKFGLMSTSTLVFIYFSLNKSQANLTGFGQFRSLIDSVPYFKENFPRDENINSILKFPEKILMTYGSNSDAMIGMNIFGSILDEANFFGGETTDANASTMQVHSKVSDLYTSIVNRSRSRFMKNGKDDSMNILISSSTHQSSFTQQIINAAAGDPHTIIVDAKLWDVKPKGTYSSEMFGIFTGNDTVDAVVIDNIGDLTTVRDSEGLPKIEDFNEAYNDFKIKRPHLVTEVPMDFRKSFDKNLQSSLQDIAGISTAPTGRLFSSKPIYYKCIDPELEHPFTKMSPVLATKLPGTLDRYLKRGFSFKDPHKPRFIHIDQSAGSRGGTGYQGDATGIAMVHVDYIEETEIGERIPHFKVDFKLQVLPPKAPYKLSIAKVREFMFYLRDVMGVNIKKITYDFFASQESTQILEEGGFNVEYQSVDKTDEAYLNYVSLLYEERIKDYDYEPSREELFNLMHDRVRRKVDHPKKPTFSTGDRGYANYCSKDVMDALVGALMSALKDSLIERSASDIVEFNSSNEEGVFDDLLDDYDFEY